MNHNIGLLFPGQGSQYVGMGADLYDRYPAARDTYDRAADVLEMDIRAVSFNGPDDTLRQTQFTQPAILVHSMAVLSTLPELKPMLAAGHSLGEYSALYCAGSLDFDSVLKLVRQRGALMGAEGQVTPGTMAAIIGMDAAAVRELCDEVDGVVVPANYNEPLQTVISGEIPAVERAVALAPERGARKAVLLPVSGAFHSPLLAQSATEFATFLEGFSLKTPGFPIIPNVLGRRATDAEEIRSALQQQLTSPVRWVETITAASEAGCTTFLEVGPGKVLAGLARRINRDVSVTPLGTVDAIEAFRSA